VNCRNDFKLYLVIKNITTI